MKDIYTDNGTLLREKFPQIEDVPTLLKEAVDLRDIRAAMADGDFALTMDGERLWPLADAGNVALSTIYFLETSSDLPAEMRKAAAARLADACTAFDILPPEPLVKLAEGVEEPPTVDVDSPAAVSTKLAHFAEHFKEYSPPQRHEVAVALASQAAGHKLEPPAVIAKYAAVTLAEDFPLHIRARLSLLPEDSQCKELYEYLLAKAAETSVDELAEALYEVDKAAEVTPHYDSRLADPFAATHGVTIAAPRTVHMGDTQLDEAAIRKCAAAHAGELSEEAKQAFASDPVGTFERLPEALRHYLLS